MRETKMIIMWTGNLFVHLMWARICALDIRVFNLVIFDSYMLNLLVGGEF